MIIIFPVVLKLNKTCFVHCFLGEYRGKFPLARVLCVKSVKVYDTPVEVWKTLKSFLSILF